MTEKNVLNFKRSSNTEAGEDIGLELGAKLIKNYYDANGEVRCHYVGRNILEKILSQPSCEGIKIYKAIDEKGLSTYVLVGMNSSGKSIMEYTIISPNGQLSKENGIVADRLPTDGNSSSWFL